MDAKLFKNMIFSMFATTAYFEENLLIIATCFVKDGVDINSRKLLSYDVVLDYEDPGANSKHDPRGKRWGGGKT